MKIRQLTNNKTTVSIFMAGAAAGALALGAAGMIGPDAVAQAPRLSSPASSANSALSFADIVEEVSPSVVSVLVEREVESPQIPSQLEEFFFRFGEPRGGRGGRDGGRGDGFDNDNSPRTLEAQGSGFFIDNKGHVVTNNHVIADATRVKVVLSDGEELSAEIIGADPETDLAVLKVESSKKHPHVEFAEDVNLRVGDWVLAVGNPFGLSGTVTSGIVSAIGRETPGGGGQFTDFIQVDAPINRGNSGGPTFDLKGRVVGVNTAIYSTTGGSVGIGFAIPAKIAKSTIKQLIDNGSVTRGWLGVQIQDLTEDMASALELKSTDGALVGEVITGTPAQKSGLRDGDLIIGVDGKKLRNSRDLTRTISSLPPGGKTRLKLLRDGKERIVNVTLGRRDTQSLLASNDNDVDGGDIISRDLGLRVTELNDDLRDQYRVPEDVDGLMVTGVRNGSPADEAGLRNGIVILQIDGDKVTNSADLTSKIEKAKKDGRDAVLLRMQLGEVKQFGALPLDAG